MNFVDQFNREYGSILLAAFLLVNRQILVVTINSQEDEEDVKYCLHR